MSELEAGRRDIQQRQRSKQPAFLPAALLQRFILLSKAFLEDESPISLPEEKKDVPSDVCVSFLRVMTAAVAFAPTSVLDPRLRAVNAVVTSAGYFIGRCDGRISEEIRAFFGAAAKAVREPAMRAQLRADIVREGLLHWFSFLIMNIAAESDHDVSENAAMISLLTNDVRWLLVSCVVLASLSLQAFHLLGITSIITVCFTTTLKCHVLLCCSEHPLVS